MSIENTLQERGSRYGDFSDHAKIAQDLQDVMRRSEKTDASGGAFNGWTNLSAVQKQALTVIADKIARILSGDPDYADNWHDIQGYARLAEERLPVEQAEPVADNENQPVCDCGSFGRKNVHLHSTWCSLRKAAENG